MNFFDLMHGIVADGPMEGEVISQPREGDGFGHCEDNDEANYVHYSWHPLKQGETVENPLDDRVITGRWKLDEKPSAIVNIEGVDTRGVILGQREDTRGVTLGQ